MSTTLLGIAELPDSRGSTSTAAAAALTTPVDGDDSRQPPPPTPPPLLPPTPPVIPTTATTTEDCPSGDEKSLADGASMLSFHDNRLVVKVALVGDGGVGKTSLMVKYVENKFDEDTTQSIGVNFMEKCIPLLRGDTEITISIWDLGGQREFLYMLPIVCNDAAAVFFIFDLSRKSTLLSIKEWYRQARGLNRTAHAFLVGTKYDIFVTYPVEEQMEMDKLARKYAKAMNASLVFTSASHSINIQKVFKVVLAKVFELETTIGEMSQVGEPLFLFV
jgi:GTP-binding protein of the ras superfamily involved in termination of M-phase